MEKSGYDLSDADNLELVSGTVATTLPSDPQYSRMERKQAQQSNCMQNCCIITFAAASILALCAAVAAIILILAFTNPTLRVLSDELTALSPSTANNDLSMIQQSLMSTANSVGTLLERLVACETLSQ